MWNSNAEVKWYVEGYRVSVDPFQMVTHTCVRHLVADLRVEEQRCLEGPAPGHVPDSVSTTSQHQRRDVEPLHKLDTLTEARGGRKRDASGEGGKRGRERKERERERGKKMEE